MPIDWKAFAEIVQAGNKFLLTSHMRPDCDALGSELGMQCILESLGKEVAIVNGDTVPPHIAFIDANKRVQTLGTSIQVSELADFDVMMVLDTSAWVQLGPMADVLRNFQGQKVVVDHHVSEDDMDAATFKDATSEATGRLVLQAAEALNVTVTQDMAAALFAAIATDTGWFRFSSVNEKTFTALAKLVAAGANPGETFASLYEQNTLSRLKLRARILAASEMVHDGQTIYSAVMLKDFAETGSAPTDTEDVVNMLLSVAGTKSAMLFIETDENRTKASLRSRGLVDVRAIAEQFGGGGHTAAAGVSFPGSVEEAKKAILEALSKVVY